MRNAGRRQHDATASVEVELKDGSRVTIRPLGPDDRDELRQGFERLSPESRYRRFFAPVSQLTERQLEYLTNVDQHDHVALVAVDPATGDGAGVARFVRTDGDVAEPAIVVIDDWQGRGLGGRLMDRLVERAREEGVRRFVAPVLAENVGAIRMMERVGETTRHSAGHEVELDIVLPDAPEEDRGPWLRALLRAVAAGTLAPARTLRDIATEHAREAEAARPDPAALGRSLGEAIVVGTDGSDHARAAVRTAVGLACTLGAPLHVVAAHRFVLDPRREMDDLLRDTAAAIAAEGVGADMHLRRGDPADAILDVARETGARLVVVGDGERRPAARLLLGSVSNRVSHHAPCNVLIVR